MVSASSQSSRFDDRVVLITGACGGIGRAVAQRFATEGARLAFADHNFSKNVDGALVALDANRSIRLDCDVSQETQAIEACERTLSHFGTLDVIVNVAGIIEFRPFIETTAEQWRRVLDINLMGAVYFARFGLRCMKPGSAIVNVSSIHAIQTSANVAPYAASKAALCSLTRSLAIEGKPLGIRANAVLPGAIDTPILRASPNITSGAEILEPDDIGTPADVASVIAFLASDEAHFITGASVVLDGGRLTKL